MTRSEALEFIKKLRVKNENKNLVKVNLDDENLVRFLMNERVESGMLKCLG